MNREQSDGSGLGPLPSTSDRVGPGGLSRDRVREQDFTQDVIDTAQHYCWTIFHLRDRESVHIVRGRGFPDLVMYRKDEQSGQTELLAAELKRGYDREATVEQEAWLEALGHHIPTRTWRPEDWDEIERVLRDGPGAAESGHVIPGHRIPQLNNRMPSHFARTIAGLVETIEDKELARGYEVRLRRMNPSHPDNPAFWRLMAREGMPANPDIRKWGLIIQGMALMAFRAPLAHNPTISVGRSLYEGGGNRIPFYSEDRLSTLLGARGETLLSLLQRLFRMLSGAGCSFDWREMAWFILTEGEDETAAVEARMKIASQYYQAERRNAPASGDENN